MNKLHSGAVNGINRSSGTALDRDLNYAADLTFVVDAPNGNYDITLITGDRASYQHDQMGVYLEGAHIDTLTTAPRDVLTLVYTNVTVSDGQLTLRMSDLGGIDANVVINGLELVWVGTGGAGGLSI